MLWASTFALASISPSDFCVRSASFLTSSATTAKPRPCSPARAASIAAFRASKFVWSAISRMITMMFLISSLWRVTSCAFWLMAFIELLICSTAAALSWIEWACLLAPSVKFRIESAKILARSSSICAAFRFSFSIWLTAVPALSMPTIISFRSLSSPSCTSTLAV